jgi:GT2 family glycosyltransferase
LVRRSLWEDVGLFDPGFRVYYEDHDLCIRARRAGWRIRYAPGARIRHKVAGSTGEGSPAQLYLLARSSVRFYWKHSRGLGRAFIFCYRCASLALTLCRCLREGRHDSARAYLRGIRDGLCDLRRPSDRSENWPAMTDRSIAMT